MPAITKHPGTSEALEQRPGAYAWYALAVLTTVYVLNFLDRTLIYILFTPIKKKMAFTDLELALLGTTSFVIFYTLLGIPFGRLADRTVRKNLIVFLLREQPRGRTESSAPAYTANDWKILFRSVP